MRQDNKAVALRWLIKNLQQLGLRVADRSNRETAHRPSVWMGFPITLRVGAVGWRHAGLRGTANCVAKFTAAICTHVKHVCSIARKRMSGALAANAAVIEQVIVSNHDGYTLSCPENIRTAVRYLSAKICRAKAWVCRVPRRCIVISKRLPLDRKSRRRASISRSYCHADIRCR